METEIQNELGRLLNCIKETNGKPINLVNLLSESVMNVLWKYVAGKCNIQQLLFLGRVASQLRNTFPITVNKQPQIYRK